MSEIEGEDNKKYKPYENSGIEEGDSIYFDSQQPHGMKALDGEKVCFLAVIL